MSSNKDSTKTSSTNATSNDATRDAQEGVNRLKEDVQHGYHDVKRKVVGGSETSDRAKEAVYHGENRASEVGNRIGDKVSKVATDITRPKDAEGNTKKTDNK